MRLLIADHRPHGGSSALARRTARAAFATICGLTCGIGAPLFAAPPDEPDPSDAGQPFVAPADRGTPPSSAVPRLLVLVNDRIVEGRIARTAVGYEVGLANGTYTIPFERVKFEARDLQDAYRKQQILVKAPTARTHVALAHWCLTFNLVEEAKQELREALRLSPSDEGARAFLKRLEELLRIEDPVPTKPAGGPERSGDGFARPAARSLAGLSRSTATTFTLKIQPLLVNTCGAASCHGSAAENPFRLYAVRLGYSAHRVHSERNLATVLEYVDEQHPDRSPLLTAPRGNHGKGGRAVFHGPGGADQQELLKEWVQTVAAELSGVESARAEPSRSRPSLPTPMRFPAEAPPSGPVPIATRPAGFGGATNGAGPHAVHGPPVSRPVSPLAIPSPSDPSPDGENFAPFGPTSGRFVPPSRPGTAGTDPTGTGGRPAPPSADAELRRILEDSRPDAFDPDEFNRQRSAPRT